jgi:glycosyltransferase involved in cell wall biosynthesis
MAKRDHKNKKRRLLMLTDGNFDQASARIRALQYIPMLEASGYSVSYIPRIPLKPERLIGKYTWFPLLKRLFWLKRYFAILFLNWDVIFVQRLFIDEFLLKRLTRKSKLIYDFDDAIYLGGNNQSAGTNTANMVHYACTVIVSTPLLNEFCIKYGKNAIVIPTPVETDLIQPSHSNEKPVPVIGWIGSAWTTGYLELITPVLQKLSLEIDFEFLTVGVKPDYSVPGVKHKNLPWEFGIEVVALTNMDIGIMPLPDDDYARAKGGYKLYLYMAAGLPCVASPVGVNNQIIRNGENGFLASSPELWYENLKALLVDKKLRMRMGEKGRQQAVARYDRKVCFSELIKLIDEPKI